MITPADLPTVRVVLRGPVDLIRPASGRPVRVEVVFDAHVPHDVEGVVRPFARLRRYNGTPGSFVSLGGPLLTERPDSWKAAAWTGIYPADIRAVSPHVFSPYEYLPESGPGVPHRITGDYSFATAEQKIFALEGRSSLWRDGGSTGTDARTACTTAGCWTRSRACARRRRRGSC